MTLTPEFVAAVVASLLSGTVLLVITAVSRGMRRVEDAIASIRESLAAEKQIRIEHERRLARAEARLDSIEKELAAVIAR